MDGRLEKVEEHFLILHNLLRHEFVPSPLVNLNSILQEGLIRHISNELIGNEGPWFYEYLKQKFLITKFICPQESDLLQCMGLWIGQ